jgi:hypothetical protein
LAKELDNVRQALEQEQKCVRLRVAEADKKNRKFFEKAASQIDTDSDSRKLLRMVR